MVGSVIFPLLFSAETLSGAGNQEASIYGVNKDRAVPSEFNGPVSFGNTPSGIRYVPRLP